MDLAARFVAPRLTRTDVVMLPEECWAPLQRHMDRLSQVNLFRDFKQWYGNGELERHVKFIQCANSLRYPYVFHLHGECKVWNLKGQLTMHILYELGEPIKDFLAVSS